MRIDCSRVAKSCITRLASATVDGLTFVGFDAARCLRGYRRADFRGSTAFVVAENVTVTTTPL
jgi:hypothetical protein